MDQRRGVSVDDAKDFDFRLPRRRIELPDQRLNQLQVALRTRNDQRVIACVRRDLNIAKRTGAKNSSPIRVEQLECCSSFAIAANSLNRLLQCFGYVGRQSVFDFENLSAVYSIAFCRINVSNEFSYLLEISRRGIDDQRVRRLVRCELYARSKSASVLEEVLQRLLDLRSRAVLQPKDFGLRLRCDRSIELLHQLFRCNDSVAPTDDQNRIRLHQWQHRNSALSAAHEIFANLADNFGDRFTLSVLEWINTNLRLGILADEFQLLNDLGELI